MIRLPALAIAAAFMAGCATTPRSSETMPFYSPAWRDVATNADRERLRVWRQAFEKALAAAKRSGHQPELAAEGSLLIPDAALADPAIPDGRYKCRVIKLGGQSEGLLDYIAYPAFDCIVGHDGSLQRFDKISGSQRHVGILYANDAMRMVFLGTLALGDERRAMRYGQDESRDVAGYLERIGPARWRLILPYPRYESLTDVLELTPAS
jgi:hypothetical protein